MFLDSLDVTLSYSDGYSRTLSAYLRCMCGAGASFDVSAALHLNSCSEKKIFVIAATNQPQKIDPAVRRTGRLDKLIYVGPPDEEARREMLTLHLEGRPVAADFDVGALAEKLKGYSASDIRFLVDEAARDALKKRQDISSESFRSAMTRIQASVTPEIEAQYQSIEQRGL